MKTVSVGIPSYNEGTNIVTILESVINSKLDSVELCEIIISDDSTDETPDVVKKFMENNSEKIVFLIMIVEEEQQVPGTILYKMQRAK